MARLVDNGGWLPDIELTKEEWEAWRSNTLIKGKYFNGKIEESRVIRQSGVFRFYLDE